MAGCIVLAVGAVVCLAAAIALFARADSVDDALSGAGTSFQELSDRDDAVALTTGLYVLAMLIAGPLVIIWQYRHAVNAQRLSGPLGLGPGWAIGGWFVPLGNLVLPAVQLVQAGRASDPDARPATATGQLRGRTPPVVIVWAIAWALGGAMWALGAGMRPTEDGSVILTEDFAGADRTAGAGMAVLAVSAALAIAMIWSLTGRQQRADRTRPPWAGAGQPWATAPGAWGAPPPAWGPASSWGPPPAGAPDPWGGTSPAPPPGNRPPPPPPPPTSPPGDRGPGGAWGPPG